MSEVTALEVTVLGAGPAGLLAALEAAEAGHSVTMVEAADRVGGMSASFEVAGQRVDYGSHRLHPATDPRLMARLKELLGDDLQARERHGRIRLRGRWIGFPLRMVDMVRSLPPTFSASVALDTATGVARRNPTDTFAGEITRRLGPTIFREFYQPYSRKLYGVDPDHLARELADRRVAASSPLQILAKVVKATRTDGRLFWYPKHGYGQIAERLADAAVDAGVDLRLSSPVDAIDLAGDRPVVTAGSWTGSADIVLSTIPQRTLANVVSPGPPPPVQSALASLRTRAMVLVYLVLPQSQYTPFDAHYFPEESVEICRLSESKNYRDGADPASQTVLCAELACWQRDDVWNASVSDLQAKVVDDLIRSGLPKPNVVHAEVHKLASVYPVYEPQTQDARAEVHTWMESLPNLLSFGRQGLGVPDNLHHVLAMGAAAVDSLDSTAHISASRWRQSLADFATHVVQD